MLEHYQPAAPAGEAVQAVPETHSLLCVPVGVPERPLGVVMLGSAMSRLVFDAVHLTALGGLAREAGAALGMNARLLAAEGETRRVRESLERRTARLHWAQGAAQAEGLDALMAAWAESAAAPQGHAAALLCLREDDGLHLAAAWGAVPDESALRPLFPLPVGPRAGGQADAALTRHMPLAGAALDAPSANESEQALLQALGAGPALWLPLVRQGTAFGVVLLPAGPPAVPAPDVLEAELMEPLRLLAPALHAAWRTERIAAERAAQETRAWARERDATAYRRFVPPALAAAGPDTAAVLGAAERGVARTVPVLAGTVPGLSDGVADDGALPALLRRYFAQVEQGLLLHEGHLERIEPRGWCASYRGGVDGALWGVQTLHQLLLALRDDITAEGVPLPPTGLGLHRGGVAWGAVPAGEALLPMVLGAGLHTAERLAAMSLTFRCGVLVSQAAVDALQTPGRFDLRHLGKLRPAAGEERIDVYELFSVREAEVVAPMRDLQGVWAEALREFQRGRWRRAAGGFGHYVEQLPQDRPARYFLRQCRQRAQA